MIAKKVKYYIFIIPFLFCFSLHVYSNRLKYYDYSTLVLSDSLILRYKYNRLSEIYPDTLILINDLNNLSYYYYTENNLFYISNDYACKFSFLTHRIDTLYYLDNMKSFIYMPDAIYLLNDVGLWKNDIPIISGNIKSFYIWQNKTILFLRNDTLFQYFLSSREHSFIDGNVSSFCSDENNNLILLKKDSIFINNKYITDFNNIPDKFYSTGNRLIIYAKDSVFSFTY